MHELWSPRWKGVETRPVAEETPALRFDRALRSFLSTAHQGSIEPFVCWIYQGDQAVTPCQLRVLAAEDDRMVLTVSGCADAFAASQDIAIDWVTQRLGGRRAWWQCPGCGRRCGVLFNPSGRRWCCRVCAQITYRSSNASDRRVSAALTAPNLLHALRQLERSEGFSGLLLRYKANGIIRRRTLRDYRRWFRRIHPRRHLPRLVRNNSAER